jgi:PHD/YefM family antitoxin component YafN of YafNO toxin-antitoxin module
MTKLPHPGAGERPLMVSEARAHLFDLYDSVTQHSGRMVRIARRGQSKRVVLVGEEYIEALQAQVRALTQQLKAIASGGARPSFSLIGSATLQVPADDVFAATRARQAELADAKRRTLTSED